MDPLFENNKQKISNNISLDLTVFIKNKCTIDTGFVGIYQDI